MIKLKDIKIFYFDFILFGIHLYDRIISSSSKIFRDGINKLFWQIWYFNKIGCASAPVFNYASEKMGMHPMILFGFFCFIASIISLKLPEGLNNP